MVVMMTEIQYCPASYGEHMINLAEGFLFPRECLIVSHGKEPEGGIARIKTALRFYRMPVDFKFRAMVEEWSQERIIQEMY